MEERKSVCRGKEKKIDVVGEMSWERCRGRDVVGEMSREGKVFIGAPEGRSED